MTKLSLKTRGVKGRSIKWQDQIGEIIAFPTRSQRDFISIDAYEGWGNTYKKRSENAILIEFEGKQIFSGTFCELVEVIKNSRQKTKSLIALCQALGLDSKESFFDYLINAHANSHYDMGRRLFYQMHKLDRKVFLSYYAGCFDNPNIVDGYQFYFNLL